MQDISSLKSHHSSDPNTVLDQVAKSCQIFSVDRLPIIAAFCHKIGIGHIINGSINTSSSR